jgi:hypothetical protein
MQSRTALVDDLRIRYADSGTAEGPVILFTSPAGHPVAAREPAPHRRYSITPVISVYPGTRAWRTVSDQDTARDHESCRPLSLEDVYGSITGRPR